MSEANPIRTRLAEEGGAVTAVDKRAAELFASVEDAAPLDPAEYARLRARIVGEVAKRSTRRPPLFVGRSLLIAALLVSSVAAAGVVVVRRIQEHRADTGALRSDHAREPAPAPAAAREEPAEARAPTMRSAPEPIDEPAHETPPPSPRASAPRSLGPLAKPAPTPPSESIAPEPPPESALSEESRAFAAALRALRQERDGRGALQALDAYAQHYPNGAFKEEAELARIDALLLAGRRGDALRLLDAKFLDALPRGVELRVARGELRLEAGRAVDARRDFDAAMPSASGEHAERAFYGRAVSRAKAGDEAGARADFEAYLKQYPDGRFASKARESLRGAP